MLGGDLPDRRERLYAEAVDLLLYLWEQRRLTRDQKGNIELLQPSVAEYLGSDKEQVRKLLETPLRAKKFSTPQASSYFISCILANSAMEALKVAISFSFVWVLRFIPATL